MNASNPFQIPTCIQANLEQRRRERFRKWVVTTVAAVVTLLVGLLVEGCMSRHSQTASESEMMADNLSQSPEVSSALEPKPIPALPVPLAAAPQVVSAVPKANAPLAVTRPETVWVVKSGDTLTRLAKNHGTTVQAIKLANRLAGDRIVVGAKLRIPV